MTKRRTLTREEKKELKRRVDEAVKARIRTDTKGRIINPHGSGVGTRGKRT